MKRFCLLGTAVAAVLIVSVAAAVAATPHGSKSVPTKSPGKKAPATTGTKVSCQVQIASQAAAGTNQVSAGEVAGTRYGTTRCVKLLGVGVWAGTFDTAVSGDISGKWQEYFNSGTVYGAYTLAPSLAGSPAADFAAASYSGTLTVKSGTGSYAKAAGKGTLSCTTDDSVHYACKETLRLALPTATKS